MDIYISGSLAVDRIMNFDGDFSDHIVPEKLHSINISFTTAGLSEKFGGTAGNISYGLSLLDEHPSILATIGYDYVNYFSWLQKNRLATQTIKIIENEPTASAYITTDRAKNQITSFNPGSMNFPSSFNLRMVDPLNSILIISAGNITDMREYPAACKTNKIDYIFDPGQSIPMWNNEELMKAIDGAKLLIANDYEMSLIIRKTGLSTIELLKLSRMLITTKGENGSVITTPAGEEEIPAIAPNLVADPTGAGDAYRSGIIKGLARGLDISDCAIMGSVCASFAIENYGPQEYTFNMDEFNQRLP